MNKYLGVNDLDKKFKVVRAYVQYLKTDPNHKDNQSMVDHLRNLVPPMWKLWPSRPHDNFDDESFTKEHYDVFFGYMRNLGDVQTNPTSQDCMNALLKLVKILPTLIYG